MKDQKDQDHDQRFKNLLQEFFLEFMQLFFPQWVARFDFNRIEWISQELFTDPPQGTRLAMDLVAKLPTLQPLATPRGETAESWITLIHVEIEGEDRVAPLRRRVFEYYEQLRGHY